jgi:hypothetical protein
MTEIFFETLKTQEQLLFKQPVGFSGIRLGSQAAAPLSIERCVRNGLSVPVLRPHMCSVRTVALKLKCYCWYATAATGYSPYVKPLLNQ